ncbi:MAG: hypothetical protein ABTA24_00745 [Arthrobacter sp.]
MRPLVKVLSTAGLLLTVPACGASGPAPDGAEETAVSFYAALDNGEYNRACGMLAPATFEDIQQAEDGGDQACAGRLRALSLQDPGEPLSAQAFGRNAQVAFDSETVFLTLSSSSWKVMAAGCTARGDRPYSCLVEGE